MTRRIGPISLGDAVAATCVLAYLVVCVRSAWVGDDAYITLRTVDNFVNGYGLRWNVAERVQAYTHPLWMFVLSAAYFFTREAFYTTCAVSLACSTAVAWLVVRHVGRSTAAGLTALALLVSSKAFVDYAASGLENPLTHLLLVAYALTLRRHLRGDGRAFHLGLIAALGQLTRMDTALIYLPGLAWVLARTDRRAETARSLALGFIPFAVWEAFSIVYYGFPFPNTAYAKLNTGIPSSDLFVQGLRYLYNSLILDPVTLPLILLACGCAAVLRSRLSLLLCAGSVLYLLYVVKIGGDFMSGRFLTGPFLLSVIVLARTPVGTRFRIGVAALAVGFSVTSADSPLRVGIDYVGDDGLDAGIADERAFYYQRFGLLRALDGHLEPPRPRPFYAERITLPQIQRGIGFAGYSWGPNHHVIDIFALADPLLARLPNEDLDWRIGHFRRAVPVGYPETAVTGENRIAREPIARAFDRISRVTRGPIWSFDRWADILRLNLGGDANLDDIHAAQSIAYRARRLLDEGRSNEALSLLERARALDPHSNPAALLTARALRERGELEEAGRQIVDVFERVSVAHEYEEYRNELYRIAIAWEQAGEPAKATELIGKTVEIDPAFVGGHLNLGYAAFARGDLDGALPHFIRGMLRIPIADRNIRGWLSKRGLTPDDLGPLAPLLPFDIRNVDQWLIFYDLAVRYVDRHEAGEALIGGLRYAGPDERLFDRLFPLIQWLADRGQLREAGELVWGASLFVPDAPVLHYNLGAIREALGLTEEARRAYRRAAELDPGDPDVRSALERLGG